jgi:hypothetical protein
MCYCRCNIQLFLIVHPDCQYTSNNHFCNYDQLFFVEAKYRTKAAILSITKGIKHMIAQKENIYTKN